MREIVLSQSRVEGDHILYDASSLDQPAPNHFDPAWWRAQDRLAGEAQGRGSAYFLKGFDGDWVLRHFRRGGWIGRWVDDRYLFTGLERSRPFRELRLLARLCSAGLPVPRPVAARLSRQGLSYRADLLIEQVPGTPLGSLLESDQADMDAFRRVGSVIRRFHQAGVFHADLNARNILVSDQAVYLIDFDRGALRSPGAWKRHNLDRLQRSCKKILGPRWADEPRWGQAWLVLEQAYEVTNSA
ncbi:3-deoxy-D-manno-octulosonic acid kinase [Natronospira proteinivora]|uniref:3-deoxy-D-manno-octulosonic acid kinase n=1 Tax=Natronospira proteinivora TaxID=1807133 RepID=A0ABT1GBG9_9GAMM|nr:3-deoxy-D-manno-octulosonic acid kinase [Natronospira proteinivora]MCP1728626.1 3-deoxy-D-manno-octulosonic acid kinase [Natronospira proteinivora]